MHATEPRHHGVDGLQCGNQPQVEMRPQQPSRLTMSCIFHVNHLQLKPMILVRLFIEIFLAICFSAPTSTQEPHEPTIQGLQQRTGQGLRRIQGRQTMAKEPGPVPAHLRAVVGHHKTPIFHHDVSYVELNFQVPLCVFQL